MGFKQALNELKEILKTSIPKKILKQMGIKAQGNLIPALMKINDRDVKVKYISKTKLEPFIETPKSGEVFLYVDKKNKEVFLYFKKFSFIGKMADLDVFENKTLQEWKDIFLKNENRILEDKLITEIPNDLPTADNIISQADLKIIKNTYKNTGHLNGNEYIIVKNGNVIVDTVLQAIENKKQVSQNLEFAVPLKEFKKLGDFIEIKENNTLTNGSLTLENNETLLKKDFKEILTPKQTKINLTLDEAQNINKIASIIDKTNPKYELLGVHIKSDDKNIIFEATDTKRLMQYKMLYSQELSKDVIIPYGAFIKGDITNISFNESYYFVETKEFNIGGELIKGRYPDLQRVIGDYKNANFVLEIETTNLYKTLNKKMETNEVKLSFSNDVLTISILYDDKPSEIIDTTQYKTIRNMQDLSYDVAFDKELLKGVINKQGKTLIYINEPNIPIYTEFNGLLSVIMPLNI